MLEEAMESSVMIRRKSLLPNRVRIVGVGAEIVWESKSVIQGM
jgi:hypothetical protein